MLQKPPNAKYPLFEGLSCTGCALEVKGQGFSLPSGTGKNGVLLLAEALGAAEMASGVPFSGDAGYQLTKTLKRTQYHRDDFTIWNCCACRPPNNWLEFSPWEADAILHCDQYLKAVIQAKRPRVIMPMGNIALRSVLGRRGIQSLRGYVYEAIVHDHQCLIVPTYHPAFILRGQDNLTGVQIYDIQRAVRVSRDGYHAPEQHYVEHPTESDLERFVEEARNAALGGAWLSIDIETPTTASTTEDEYGDIIDTDIICIGFSFREHTGCTMRWTNAHLPYIEQLLQLPFAFNVFWNQDFDVPRIQSKGLVVQARVLDGMWAWHFLQSDLPKGLGFVSTFFTEMQEWKSDNVAHPEYYNCCDVDAALQNTLGIQRLLQKEGRWDAFIHHVVELDPILKQMGRAGVLVDQDKRAAFRAKMQEELDEIDKEIQSVTPAEVRPFKPRRKVPSDAVLGGPLQASDVDAVWDYDRNTGEWGIRKAFLYGSSKQLIAYMRHQKHPVPKNHKTQADTTGKADLDKLAKRYPKDPLYKLVVQAREHQKLIGTYIDGYEPDVDGRVRTTFTFKPSTGRLASEHPNVQNIPKRNSLSKPFREQFVPAPGHVLVEFDYKACQAVIVGWLAKDQEYIKACRVGVHAVMASHVLTRQQKMLEPIAVDSPTAAEQVKVLKKAWPEVYSNCKAVVHGSAFGGTPFKLKMDFPDSFPTLKDAEDMQKLYFGTVGRKIRQWQHDTLQLADRQCYLETPHKLRHYFWSIFVWDSRRREMVMGTAAKDALAFKPQAIERCVQTDAIQHIVKVGWVKVLRWPIHDSVLCEVHQDAMDDVVPAIKGIMEAPVPELDGLRFDVDVAWSDKNWASMIEWAC